MSLRVPKISGEIVKSNSGMYSLVQTSIALDKAIEKMESHFSEMIELASKEKSIQLITGEILKIRRRVNALEYILIPDLEDTIKYIAMKLEEQERNAHVKLLRIKDIVRAPKHNQSSYRDRFEGETHFQTL